MKAYYVGIGVGSFRPGEPAEIIGVEFHTPEGREPRACFRIRYEDGHEDLTVVHQTSAYQLISEEDVRLSRVG